MAFTDLLHGLVVPTIPHARNPAMGTDSNQSISGTSTTKVAWVFKVPRTGTLDKAEFFVGAVSSPSAIKVSFQDVDLATGFPDETADQFRSAGVPSVGWFVPGLMTSDGTDNGSKRAVTAGQDLAVVVEWDSTQSGSATFYGITQDSVEYTTFPYSVRKAPTFVKNSPNQAFTVVLKYDDGVYAVPDFHAPVTAVSSVSFANNSTPDERALYFSVPFACKLAGAIIKTASITVDYQVVLYDTDGTTVLASVTFDGTLTGGSSNARFPARWTPVTLTAGGFYRVALKPTSTSVIALKEITFPSVAIGDAMPGLAGSCLSTRTDAGSWSQTTTQRPLYELLLTSLDVGGTSIKEPGTMSGGLL